MVRLGLAILASALVLLPASLRGDDPKELKIQAIAKDLSEGTYLGPIRLKSVGPIVIRSAEELVAASGKPTAAKDLAVQKEMEAALAKLLKVEAIDWRKQMILVGIVQGFETLASDGKVLTVTILPFNERPTRAPQKYPKELILTERFEGDVKFVPKK
jgi:hypothetical protein